MISHVFLWHISMSAFDGNAWLQCPARRPSLLAEENRDDEGAPGIAERRPR